MSAENNPFASTGDQVNARFARIQQEVDRLRAAGMFSAADAMSRRLQHFQLELAGLEPSQVAGPELDAVGMVTGFTDNPSVQIHPTDRPVVLALGGYELIHWSLSLYPGANLQKVIVSGYQGVAAPSGVPAGVPVELHTYIPNTSSAYFYFSTKNNPQWVEAANTMYRLSGVAPSTMQGLDHYLGQPFSIGSGSVEWTQERVLRELQPLYNDATAFALAQDRAASEQYRFTGLYQSYGANGVPGATHVAQMTPLHAIDGTIQPKSVSYRYIAVDPRGPTYYAISSSGQRPVTFDPVTGVETALPLIQTSSISGMTFDTLRNRLVIGERAGDPPGYRFLMYNTINGTWTLSAGLSSGTLSPSTPSSLAYSALLDAFFTLRTGANGAAKLVRFDGNTLAGNEIELSRFLRCDDVTNPCNLAASGDRLVLITPPSADLYEPLLPAVQRSYLIDPTNGNVTFLGALPEPGAMMSVTVMLALLQMRRQRNAAASSATTGRELFRK